MAQRCPSCRSEVPDEARVCPNCPWSFPDEELKNLQATVATQWTPLPLAIAVIAAAVIGAGWFFVMQVFREESAPATQVAAGPVGPVSRRR